MQVIDRRYTKSRRRLKKDLDTKCHPFLLPRDAAKLLQLFVSVRLKPASAGPSNTGYRGIWITYRQRGSIERIMFGMDIAAEGPFPVLCCSMF